MTTILRAARRVTACLAVALVVLGSAPVYADGPNRVALVITHDGQTITRCVEFSESEISGYDVLQRAGVDLSVEVGMMGAAICRIDNKGCTYPQDACFCQCQGTPCVYWSYWHLNNGDWQYSSLGASNYNVRDGDVEGWAWGEGEYGVSGSRPPLVRFDDICSSSAPPPSQPATTDNDDKDLPVIDYFKADREEIAPGESVTLSWDLHDAKEAYLRVDGQEQGVVAPWSTVVAPTTTTEYVLIARNRDGEVTESVTIVVNPNLPTPTPAALPPTDTPVPPPPTATPPPPPPATATPPPPRPTATPVPPTDTPPPTAAEVAAATAPPVRSSLPTLTPTPTRTPVPLAAVPATPVIVRRTPEILVRTPPAAGPDLPLTLLVIGGGLGIAGGLVGAGLLFAAARRAAAAPPPDPRRRATPVRSRRR
jgi:hypothetical protein